MILSAAQIWLDQLALETKIGQVEDFSALQLMWHFFPVNYGKLAENCIGDPTLLSELD
ncbi:MAG: hypothetical protein WBC93_08110 [Sulfitobacter sp.]